MNTEYVQISDRAEQALMHGNLPLCLSLRREGLAFASIYCEPDSMEYIHALMGLAYALIDDNQLNEAETHLNTALSILGEPPEALEALLMLAEVRLHQGRLDDAWELLQRVEQWVRAEDFPMSEAYMLAIEFERNVGWYFEEKERFDDAITHYSQALILVQTNIEPSTRDTLRFPIINELGMVYAKLGNYSQAELYLSACLVLASKIYPNPHPERAHAHHDMANVYLESQHFDKAIFHAQSALQMNQDFFKRDHMLIAHDLALYGEIEFEREQFDHAETLLNQAIGMLERLNPKGCAEMEPVFELLADLYDETDRPQDADEMRDAARIIRKHFGDDEYDHDD